MRVEMLNRGGRERDGGRNASTVVADVADNAWDGGGYGGRKA
jgi:hypothetical protein